MKKLLLFGLAVISNGLCFQTSFGQCVNAPQISFQNPSFEGAYPNPGVTPAPWTECMPGQTPDTQPGAFGVNMPPTNGNSYLGLVAEPAGNWQEGASEPLSSAMIAGVTYSFTVDLANSSSTGGGIDPGCAECQVWAGFQACDDNTGTGVLVWSSGNITPFDTWSTYTVTFTPTQNYTWIMFRVNSLNCSTQPYILIDNIGTILPANVSESFQVVDNVSCNGLSDGNAICHAVGQHPPFTYQWSGGNVVNDTVLSNVPAGTYTVTVTDAQGCTSTASVTITQPAALTLTPDVIEPGCGLNTGSAYMSYAGGSAPMSFSWSNGPGTQSNPNLSAGNYTITVTDDSSCTATATINIAAVNGLTVIGTVTNAGCGVADGSIAASASGGTGAYTYSWNTVPVQNSATAINLGAGSCTVTATDGNGCTGTATFSVSAPANGMSSTLTPTNLLCAGGSTGSITTNTSGGTPGYTYSWNTVPVQTGANATNLTAGTYTVTITDQASCDITASATITAPAAITGTTSTTTANCAIPGTATVNPSGGTGGYTYSWSTLPVQTGATATNLSAGPYTVTVTDANNCTFSTTATVTAAAGGLTLTPSQVNVLCFGNNTGSAGVVAGGGTPGYAYNWNTVPVQTSATATGLIAGSYSVTVTDANGCTATAPFTITQPAAALSVTQSQVNVLCFGNNSGSATVTAAGGTAGYTYNWNTAPVQTTATAINLIAGNYIVTVTDANNCTITATYAITQPGAALAVTLTPTDVMCFGQSTGSITSNATGGTTNYSYNWNTIPVQNTATAGNLAAGSYTVTVTDANNCTISANTTVNQPAAALSATIAETDVLCFGLSTGTATVTASGGTTNYSYNWNTIPVQTTATASNLPAGNYSVTVTDANNCTFSISTTVNQPATALSVTQSQVNVLCFGDNTGSATVTPAGGTGAYTYNWSTNPVQNTATATNLLAASYSVTVSDANGCTATASYVITQPAAPLAVTLSPTDILCFGQTTGAITSTTSGGTPNYTYNWSSGQNTPNLSNLSPGPYILTVTDNNACTVSATATVNQPAAAVSATTTAINVLCFGNNTGSATVIPAGGTPGYAYVWNSNPVQNTITAVNLIAGTYNVTVTDNNGCTFTTTATVTQPAAAISVTQSQVDVLCFGDNTGSATVTAAGGTGAYSYNWNTLPAQTTATASNLMAGSYTVTVTDANNCTLTSNFTINQPAAPLAVTLTPTNIACFGQSTGAVNTITSGGTTAYSYNWSSGQTTANLTNLTPGNYNLTVTDANACTVSATTTITQPAAALTATISETDVMCFGMSTGTATVSPTGGTTPYLYNWSSVPVQTTPTAAGLPAGTYNVTVADANNCTFSASTTINQPASALTITAAGTNLLCFNQSTGNATVTANGGTSGYTYNWSTNPVQTTASATNLPAGTYAVTVTDANGCTQATNVTLTEPPQLSASTSSTNITCNGQGNGTISATVTGGTPAYTYNWNINPPVTGGSATSLQPGIYNLTVTDINGCTFAIPNITITEPPALVVAPVVTPVSCPGHTDGNITSGAGGGTPPYTYAWSNGVAAPINTDLTGGSYNLTITDANGCVIDSTNLLVAVLPGVIFNATPQNILCFPLKDGSVTLAATSTFPPLEYIWSNGATTESITALDTGSYAVTITDAHNCVVDSAFYIGNDSIWAITTTPDTATIDLGKSVAIAVSATGPFGSITWWPIDGLNCTDCANPIAAPIQTMEYTVSTTDTNGCTAIDTVHITVIPNYIIYVPDVFSPNGDGINDFFEVFGEKYAWKQFSVKVFDRIGEKVYESDDMDFKWDGSYRGKPLTPSVFVYEIRLVYLDNYTEKLFKGSLTLVK